MSRSMFAFGSFVIGAVLGSLSFSLIHTSTRVQASQQPSQAPTLPSSTISMPSAIPVVPPIQFFGHEDNVSGTVQQLDGYSCEGCTITVGVLTYGGGNFNFPNTKFPRNVPVVLTGAARNTWILLMAVGAIPKPAPPRSVPLPGDRLVQADIEINAQPSISFASLEVKK